LVDLGKTRDALLDEKMIVEERTRFLQSLLNVSSQGFLSYNSDFMTLDISMPQMDGIDALKNILTSYPDAKVVIVSAVGQKQMVFHALSIGAKDFIVKPFKPDRAIKSISRLF